MSDDRWVFSWDLGRNRDTTLDAEWDAWGLAWERRNMLPDPNPFPTLRLFKWLP